MNPPRIGQRWAPATQRGYELARDVGRAVHGNGGSRGCSEPPSAALDGLLRSTPLQFAALDTIVAAVIAAAIPSLCSRSLIRARRGVRVRRRRHLRGYTASCHRSWRVRSRDRWGRAAGSRGRLALGSCGCRAQGTLSLPRLPAGE